MERQVESTDIKAPISVREESFGFTEAFLSIILITQARYSWLCEFAILYIWAITENCEYLNYYEETNTNRTEYKSNAIVRLTQMVASAV